MEYLNLVVVLTILQLVLVSGDQASERKKFLDAEKKALIKCQKDGNFPESYVDEVFTKEVVPPNSKCFVKCAFENLGFLKNDGFVNLPAFIEGVKLLHPDPNHADAALQITNDCYSKVPKGSNQCDSSSFVLDCVFKAGKTEETLKDIVHSEGH